jgi:hypothetical protein
MPVKFDHTLFAGVEGLTPANLSPNYDPKQFEDETFLEQEIGTLWTWRQQWVEEVGTRRKVVRDFDASLGQLLYHVKVLVAKPGRNGGWSSWLEERKIHRTTADRLIVRFARSRGIELPHVADSNVVAEPHEGQISTLAVGTAQRVERKLPSARSRFNFIDILAHRLGLTTERRTTGVHIADPDLPIPEPPAPEAQDFSATGETELREPIL